MLLHAAALHRLGERHGILRPVDEAMDRDVAQRPRLGEIREQPALGVSGAAYTNNDLDPNTDTTLFDIDATLDQLVIQSPPNAGSLAVVGKLGVDASGSVAFDIQTVPEDGVSVRNRGIAAFTAFGAPALYRVNLLTGAATFIGVLDTPLRDLALPLVF